MRTWASYVMKGGQAGLAAALLVLAVQGLERTLLPFLVIALQILVNGVTGGHPTPQEFATFVAHGGLSKGLVADLFDHLRHGGSMVPVGIGTSAAILAGAAFVCTVGWWLRRRLP